MKTQPTPPFTVITVNRVLIVIIVVLAMYAGYYHAVTQSYKRSFIRLQNRYARLEERLEQATASAQLEEVESAGADQKQTVD